ncbi:MAG: response regulator [Planctomycetes bacterium]|nr:response regulator [Planctomycetota bacterium]
MSKRHRVLLIDDDPLFQEMVSTLLSETYDVEVSDDGSKGFYHALENPPDVAVIDIRMPGWDGLTTLKAFRCHPKLSKLKIVMLTSDSTRSAILDAVNAGADEYIVKTSFTKKDFCETLEKLLKESHSSEECSEPSHSTSDSSGTLPDNRRDEAAERNLNRTVSVSSESSRQLNGADGNDDHTHLQEMIDSWE